MTARTAEVPRPAPPLLRIGDLEPFHGPDRTLELVDGHLFVSALDTPYLERTTANALAILTRSAKPGRTVQANEAIIFSDSTLVVPDVSVRSGGPGSALELVLEVRSDSTERYALGPKRMVYSREHVGEYWFLDPRAAHLLVFRRKAGGPDYPWPPLELGPEADARHDALARPVRVADLLLAVAPE